MRKDVSRNTAPSQRARRYLALWFPHLPADRTARAAPFCDAPDKAPLVFVEKIGGAVTLASVDARAAREGLHAGLGLADARARVAGLKAVPMDAAADAALMTFLRRAADRWSPSVALDPPHGLALDVTGCAHLFGGEEGLLADVARRLETWRIGARFAIAGTAEAARAQARFAAGGVTPAGGDLEAAADLPVAALEAEPQTVARLTHLGLKRIGDLAARPRAPLAARFGAALMDRLDRVVGRMDAPPDVLRPPPPLRAERRFAHPVAEECALEAALAALAEQLAREMERRGEGGRRFAFDVFRADGEARRVEALSSAPTRDVTLVRRLFRERLTALGDPLDPGFGFDLVRLSVARTEPLAMAQPRLDDGARPAGDPAGVVDRFAARLGTEAVRRFAAADSHVPERASFTAPAADVPDGVARWPRPVAGEPPRRPLFLFEPPQPVDVIAETPDEPPVRFVWRRVSHRVARAEGPERIEREWWRESRAAPLRDYYRLEDENGRRFWVFRAGLYEDGAAKWFLHGLFP